MSLSALSSTAHAAPLVAAIATAAGCSSADEAGVVAPLGRMTLRPSCALHACCVGKRCARQKLWPQLRQWLALISRRLQPASVQRCGFI